VSFCYSNPNKVISKFLWIKRQEFQGHSFLGRGDTWGVGGGGDFMAAICSPGMLAHSLSAQALRSGITGRFIFTRWRAAQKGKATCPMSQHHIPSKCRSYVSKVCILVLTQRTVYSPFCIKQTRLLMPVSSFWGFDFVLQWPALDFYPALHLGHCS
jgi:hypothetical protein